MRHLVLLPAATLTLLASPAAAQTTTSTILHVPGKTIELLGLRRWTPAMIQDSMNVYAPGESLSSHACGAVLRYKLHFAAAASIELRGDSGIYAIVPVIEPQDSALVRYRPLPLDTADSRAPWSELVALARTREDLLSAAVRARIAARGAGRAPTMPSGRMDSLEVRRVWAYLDRHRSARDAAAARRLLENAPNVRDRVAAVAILSSFERDDRTWHTLAATLRETEGSPGLFAGEVLAAFARARPHRVDWRPAAADLHAVLNGANLWMLDQVLDMLVRTGADPRLARPLLRQGGHAVLMYAGAAHPRLREPAHRFLRAVSGRDFGGDLAAWEGWIAAL
jgi:hypothetical protein